MLLVVDRKGTILRYQNGTIRIERKDAKPRNVPINQLEQVVVYGNPLVESSVWRALAYAGVPATLLASRGRMADAMLGSGLAAQLPFRRQQHQIASEPEKSLKMARYIVQLKLQSYELPLQTLQRVYAATGDTADAFRAFTLYVVRQNGWSPVPLPASMAVLIKQRFKHPVIQTENSIG